MKLSKEKKQEIRAFLEKRAEHEEGILHIDVNLLEDLLFDEYRTIRSGIVAKFPVWTGSFLRKIDLSEVSFDGVVWGPVDSRYFAVDQQELETFFGDAMPGRDYAIDLSYTNAKIDFSKCFALQEWEATMRHAGYGILIQGCDFSGVDLSNSNIGLIPRVVYTNLTNTNAKLSGVGDYSHSNLTNVDLSDVTINEQSFQKGSKEPYRFYGTNLASTGINMEFSPKTTKEDVLNVMTIMKHGYLSGCIVNGKYVQPIEKTQELHETLARVR